VDLERQIFAGACSYLAVGEGGRNHRPMWPQLCLLQPQTTATNHSAKNCNLLIEEIRVNQTTDIATPVVRISLDPASFGKQHALRPVTWTERITAAREVFASTDFGWS
jgi:hypothetical protein